MNYFFKLLCGTVTYFFFTGCSNEAINSPPGLDDDNATAKSVLNVQYGEDIAQQYDIYLPANRSVNFTKILVFIHGGGWIQGDKRDMEEYIPLLQERHPDYAIVNLNYRLAQFSLRAAFPNQFLDIKKALEHLTAHTGEYDVNPEFGLIGVSAGGHLALQFDSVYDHLDQVKLVCSIVGPTDLKDPFYTQNPDFTLALQHLIDQNAYPGVTDLGKAVSPVYFINPNSSATILFYGKEDPLVPITNGISIKEKLDAANVANSLTIFQGGHGNWSERANVNLQLELSDFIDDHLPLEF